MQSSRRRGVRDADATLEATWIRYCNGSSERRENHLLNIVLYALFNRLFGYTAANSWGNVLDNILCILFAYATNRAFVFNSKTRGRAMAKEFGAFVTCRLGTMLLDTAIMLVLGNLLAAQGAALMDELMQGVLSVVAHWLGPDTAIQMAAPMQAHRRGPRMALTPLPSSAVQTAPRQSSLPALQCAGTVGSCREGLFQCTGDCAELCVQQADHL